MEPACVLAFMTGLAGGFGHCIGMCGPVVGACSLRDPSLTPRGRFLAQILYHAGRIATYGAVGLAMGFAGSFVNVASRIAGVQNGVMILAGIIMIAMGLGVAVRTGAGWLERRGGPVLRLARTVLNGTSSLRFLPLGLLLGLLPCGLSYTIFIAAAGTGSAPAGMLTALAFGAGTLPALAVFGIAAAFLGTALRGRVQQAGGLLVVLFGLHFIMKGLRLYAAM